MKIKQYVVGVVMALAVAVSCSPDPDLYPLPYDSRATGSYLRVIKINSNTWDVNNLAGSAFTAVYESVDRNFGADLSEIRFYATYRNPGALITDEVLVKTLDAAAIASAFAAVPEPSTSDYLRSVPITVTYAETLAALSTLTTDPDGTNGVDLPQCTGIFPKTCPAIAFVGPPVAGSRVIFRVAIVDNQGRLFTVANPQNTISPALGNPNEANITPNLTGGLFYASPMLYTMFVVPTVSSGNAAAYTGNFRMTQVARWQPDHTGAQHLNFPQPWIDQFVFGSSATDSTQTVTLSPVTNGLPTERQFTASYRGTTINMVINLENQSPGISLDASNTLANPLNAPGQPASTAFGLGFPAWPATPGTTTAEAFRNTLLGTVFIPLANTTIDCTSAREFFQVTPLGGSYTGLNTLPWGLPRGVVPNRGVYRLSTDGVAAGDRFTITVDDDVDEYGRRNGYCNWYTRITLVMERLP